ncbi:MAG: TIGR03985 family CRISPR-associated protein [Cyanobacteria bacterium CRU_2_1]|nr:TIGR03985 family CRISPR-associated protein [Cyanobacteria bacterium CRU_2_1]
MIFSEPPTVELLHWLARDSLKRNLPRAVRLWVWLRCLYSEVEVDPSHLFTQVVLPEPFSYADWRNAFFSDTHPTHEAIPALHDPGCRCVHTIADWLSTPDSGIQLSQWGRTLERHDIPPTHLEAILQQRLFGITRRSLSEDLQTLSELGWLKKSGQRYRRVTAFPDRPTESSNIDEIVTPPDLGAIVNHLCQRLNGEQRFFLHVDYIVPLDALDRVEDWIDQLKTGWEQTPVPPILLTYHSVKRQAIQQAVVYPVCVYYVQRAVYLCAWGESADEAAQQLDWRNYRLDRIQAMQPLSWSDAQVPALMQQAWKQRCLPHPSQVQEKMSEAWGFDFYQPAQMMVLRFDRWFDQAYVRGTVRHDRFEPISYSAVKSLIKTHTPDPERQQTLLRILAGRSRQDAYYVAHYRQNDPNVMHRLRAWRPKMEVLLPWELRQQITEEVQREAELYRD